MKLSTIFDTLRSIWETPVQGIDLLLAFLVTFLAVVATWCVYFMLKNYPVIGLSILVLPFVLLCVAKLINYFFFKN